MRSTGEVLGMADSYGLAFFKSQEATQQSLPLEGTVLITVDDSDKPLILDTAQRFAGLGFKILATGGTLAYLSGKGVPVEQICKMHEGRPNIADAITNKQIQLVINTPAGRQSQHDDSYIRKTAIKFKIPYITTPAAAAATVRGIEAKRKGESAIKSLQEYHAGIH